MGGRDTKYCRRIGLYMQIWFRDGIVVSCTGTVKHPIAFDAVQYDNLCCAS